MENEELKSKGQEQERLLISVTCSLFLILHFQFSIFLLGAFVSWWPN